MDIIRSILTSLIVNKFVKYNVTPTLLVYSCHTEESGFRKKLDYLNFFEY